MVNLNSRGVKHAISLIIVNYLWREYGIDVEFNINRIKYDQKNWMLKIDNENWLSYDRQCHSVFKKDYDYEVFKFLETFKSCLYLGNFNKKLNINK